MPSIRFDQVSKVFDGVTAVDRLSLSAEDGEFLVMVGPSGSGKTTALRLLAGLEGATGGRILIGDKDVTRLRPQDRDIAMVFQDYALYPQMSVERNMSFALRNRGMAANLIRRRVRNAAERLDLAHLLDRKPGQLSGGQRQRVALGRAIVREPAVFLMDEPLSNLDASLRTTMRGEIKRLQRELGTTTVYVTHDQVEAMTMGDRIAIMRDGRLTQVGTAGEVYGRPADRFVGSFIGSPAMAFNDFAARSDDAGMLLVRDGLSLAIGPVAPALPERIVLGVRPEDASVWNEAASLVGPLAGTVLFVEDFGREWFAGIASAGAASFTIRGYGHPIPQIGDAIRFGLRRDGLYLFDADSGACLLGATAAGAVPDQTTAAGRSSNGP